MQQKCFRACMCETHPLGNHREWIRLQQWDHRPLSASIMAASTGDLAPIDAQTLWNSFHVLSLSNPLQTVTGEVGYFGAGQRYRAHLLDSLPHPEDTKSPAPPQLPTASVLLSAFTRPCSCKSILSAQPYKCWLQLKLHELRTEILLAAIQEQLLSSASVVLPACRH
jgi:hypothetical protein